MTLLHEQYESNGKLVIFECTECEYKSMSLGDLHAHIEKHRGYTRFNIPIPFTKTSPGKFNELMKRTKVTRVLKTRQINLEQVEGLE